MKLRKGIVWILALALLLCGCAGENTPTEPASVPTTVPATTMDASQQAVEQMQNALTQTPCSKATMVMDITMNVAGTTAQTVNTMEIAVCQEPLSSYVGATVSVTVVGQTMEEKTEAYSVVEGDKYVTYAKAGGVWTRTEIALAEADPDSNMAVMADGAQIDESVTQWEGKPAVCLTAQFSGDAISENVKSLLEGVSGGTASEAATADYSKLSCNTKIYLDPQTWLPMAQEMTFAGMEEALKPVFAEQNIEVGIDNFTALFRFESYEPLSAIMLPEGAAESAATWDRLLSGDPENGDGTYTIREGSVLVDVTHPEGFELDEKDYDHVTFTREDYRFVRYTMYYVKGSDTTGSNFTQMVNKEENHYKTNGGSIQRAQRPLSTDSFDFQCDIMGVTWGSGREDGKIYSWTPLASDGEYVYYLLVETFDGYDNGMGFSKSADMTGDEFWSYLNLARPSKLSVD